MVLEECDLKAAAAVGSLRIGQSGFVGLAKFFRQIQSKTNAGCFCGEERFKQVGYQFGGYALAIINDRDIRVFR